MSTEEQFVSRDLWDDFNLIRGGGTLNGAGVCIMQAVDYISGAGTEGNVTDHPRCVDERLSSFFIKLNDGIETVERNKLRNLTPRLIGTVRKEGLTPSQQKQYDYAPEGVDYAMRLCDALLVLLKELQSEVTIPDNYVGRVITSDLARLDHYHDKWGTGDTGYKLGLVRKLVMAFLQVKQNAKSPRNVNIDPIVEILDQVLPPARQYYYVKGEKVNVIERIHKMVGFWRERRKGLRTWKHADGLQSPEKLL